jgi:plastocyanin
VCAFFCCIALIAGLLLLAPSLASRAYATPPDTPESVRATATNDSTPDTSDVPGPTAIVKMSDDEPMYQPDSIVIRAGQTVEWVNTGQVSHSVVDDPTRANKVDDVLLPSDVATFSSGNVMPGGKYRHTFPTPGKYRYFCMSHEIDGMIGEVIVEPPTPAETAREASQFQAQPWRAGDRQDRSVDAGH